MDFKKIQRVALIWISEHFLVFPWCYWFYRVTILKQGTQKKGTRLEVWDCTRRVHNPSSAASWLKKNKPKAELFSLQFGRLSEGGAPKVRWRADFPTMQRTVSVRGNIPQVLTGRARRCHLKHHSQLVEWSEAVNCVEKSLFPFLFFWSHVVCPSACSALGELRVRSTELVSGLYSVVPWGVSCHAEKGKRVWCRSALPSWNPHQPPFRIFGYQYFFPFNWKSVAIQGLELGVKSQLEDPKQPKNLGHFVANAVCESVAFAVLIV